MSELTGLIDQARTSLQQLDDLLRKAKSFDGLPLDSTEFQREGIQRHFEEIIRMVENLPANVGIEEKLLRERELEELLAGIEQVRKQAEESLEQVAAAFEKNLQYLRDAISSLSSYSPPAGRLNGPSQNALSLKDFLEQGKQLFENKDYEACIKVLQEASRSEPSSQEVRDFLYEAQHKWEDQRLEEELVIHIENLKREASEFFEQERFEECVGMFRFLCELEPQNRTLRDYLELSQQKAQELADQQEEISGYIMGGTKSPPVASEGISPSGPVMGSLEGAESSREQIPAEPMRKKAKIDESSRSIVSEQARANEPEGLTDLRDSAEVEERAISPHHGVSKNKTLFLSLLLMAMFIGAVITLRLVRHHRPETAELTADSVPTGASIFINGELRGQTPLRLQGVSAGSYLLQIHMEGYNSFSKTIEVGDQHPINVVAQLEKIPPPSEPELLPESDPTTLYSQGKFVEASQACDIILGRDPQNSAALKLKEEIRRTLLKEARQLGQRAQWEEARGLWKQVLIISPNDAEALAGLRLLKTKQKKTSTEPGTVDNSAALRSQDLKQALLQAVTSGNYFPPKLGNVMDLVSQLNAISPGDSLVKEKLDFIFREVLGQAQRKVQNKDFEGARSMARNLQTYFSDRAELRSLREALNAEEGKVQTAREASYQKAEAAMSAGHYVSPVNDNVVAYCNRALGTDPQNTRLLALKKDALNKALAQARDWARGGKYDEARAVFQAMSALSQSEDSFPVGTREISDEIQRLDFTGFPVIHDHAIGSCTGRLRMNGYVITYVPSSDPKDAFSQSLKEIVQAETGDKLKIQFRTRTYRFQANSVSGKEENRDKLNTIYEKLTQLMEKYK